MTDPTSPLDENMFQQAPESTDEKGLWFSQPIVADIHKMSSWMFFIGIVNIIIALLIASGFAYAVHKVVVPLWKVYGSSPQLKNGLISGMTIIAILWGIFFAYSLSLFNAARFFKDAVHYSNTRFLERALLNLRINWTIAGILVLTLVLLYVLFGVFDIEQYIIPREQRNLWRSF